MESPYSRKAFSLTRLRRLFYLVTPNETTFEKLEDVPSYVDEVCSNKILFQKINFVHTYCTVFIARLHRGFWDSLCWKFYIQCIRKKIFTVLMMR